MTEFRPQPHSVQAEQALIGAVLNNPQLLADLDLQAAEFYREEHVLLYRAILALQEARRPIEVITVGDALAASGHLEIVGLEYLADIAHTAFSRNVSQYAEIIRARYLERQLIAKGREIESLGYDEGEVQDKIDRAQKLMADLQVVNADEPSHIDDCLRSTIAQLERHWDNSEGLLGLPTGFADIDSRTQGLRNGELTIVAGRPSMGKTTFAMNIAENAAMAGHFVIVFSLEMPKEQLTARMVASIAKVDFGRLQKGGLSDDELQRFTTAATRLKGRSYFIDDSSLLTSGQLLSRARRIAHRMGRKPDLVVVDYLQLLTDKGEGVDRVTRISRNLKLTAKELDCPLIALSQLNRGLENRGKDDRRPVMSDLRDSGAIEQDADLIFMLYRDEQYDENSQHKGLAEVICRKFRNGSTGTDILSSAYLNQCRFENSQVRHIEHQRPIARGRRELAYADN